MFIQKTLYLQQCAVLSNLDAIMENMILANMDKEHVSDMYGGRDAVINQEINKEKLKLSEGS